jgi:predicted short-subunit dehydrogenase-like oxidoreductase (DUF2520 family)
MIKAGNIGRIELGDLSHVVVVSSRTSSPSPTHQDDLPHTVVIPDLKVSSSMMDTDGSYEADFENLASANTSAASIR